MSGSWKNRSEGLSLAQLLRRTEVQWEELAGRLPELSDVAAEVAQQVTYDAKYEGYLARQQIDISASSGWPPARFPRRSILPRFRIFGPKHGEIRRVRPVDLAQAGRISGITPADLAVLTVHLEGGGR